MQREMLHTIHSSHLKKCKRQARDVMFLPGMAAQIQALLQTTTSAVHTSETIQNDST